MGDVNMTDSPLTPVQTVYQESFRVGEKVVNHTTALDPLTGQEVHVVSCRCDGFREPVYLRPGIDDVELSLHIRDHRERCRRSYCPKCRKETAQ